MSWTKLADFPASLALLTALTVACDANPPAGERTVAATDGTPIVYDSRGAGEPALMFVHCWACNRAFWRAQLDVFASDHTVVALDLPGHGASGRDREEWTLAGYADDVVRVVDALDLDRVILVGHSMGGPVSLLAAARLGERAEGVLCVETLHDAEFEWPEDAAEGWIAAFENDYEGSMRTSVAGMVPGNAELSDWITDQALQADRDAMLSIMHEFPTLDLAAAFSAANVPVRCINAAPYGEFSLPTAIETNRRYADFDATIMDGVGHYPHLQRPEDFNRLMREVLVEFETGHEH